jgi:predicted transcriptional regulator
MPAVSVYLSSDNYRYLLEKQLQDNKRLSEIVNELINDYRTKERDMNALLYPAVAKELHEFINEENERRQKLDQQPLNAIDFINQAIDEKIKSERRKRLLE